MKRETHPGDDALAYIVALAALIVLVLIVWGLYTLFILLPWWGKLLVGIAYGGYSIVVAYLVLWAE